MSNLHRIQWIDNQIRENRFPNCNTIADEFCISVRQASRDIEYLKDSLSAPVEYSAKKRGYYYTEETFVLPAVFLAEEEKKALSYLADRYKAIGGEMTDRLASLFEKLTGNNTQGNLTETDIPVYSVNQKIVSATETIKAAIEQRKKITLIYKDSTQQKTERTIQPFIIHGKGKQQYLHAFCEARQAERDFRIDRIQSASLNEESFFLPDHFNPADYENGTVFNFRSPYTAVVVFDPDAGLPNPGKNIQRESVQQTISFTNSKDLFKKLLGMGKGFSIISPVWLKDKFARYIQKLLQKNQ